MLLLTSIKLAARNFLLGHLRLGVRAQWPLQSGKVVRQAAECGGKSRVTAASTGVPITATPGARLGAASSGRRFAALATGSLASLGRRLALSSFFNGCLSILIFFEVGFFLELQM